MGMGPHIPNVFWYKHESDNSLLEGSANMQYVKTDCRMLRKKAGTLSVVMFIDEFQRLL